MSFNLRFLLISVTYSLLAVSVGLVNTHELAQVTAYLISYDKFALVCLGVLAVLLIQRVTYLLKAISLSIWFLSRAEKPQAGGLLAISYWKWYRLLSKAIFVFVSLFLAVQGLCFAMHGVTAGPLNQVTLFFFVALVAALFSSTSLGFKIAGARTSAYETYARSSFKEMEAVAGFSRSMVFNRILGTYGLTGLAGTLLFRLSQLTNTTAYLKRANGAPR